MKGRDPVTLIESRRWWHSIEVGDGVVTPGQVPLHDLQEMLAYLRMPKSLVGLSVLDIGAWDGFFSFEAEKRGAARVVTFDVVFLFGVLHHLRYPLLALDRLREVTDGYVLIETHHLDDRMLLSDGTWVAPSAIDPRLTDIALYQSCRNDEVNPRDLSNWFTLSRRAIEEGLWSAGFRSEHLATWGDRIAFKATRRPGIPDYRQQTYKGLTWRRHPDSRQEPIQPPREAGVLPSLPLDSPVPDLSNGEEDRSRRFLSIEEQGRRLAEVAAERNSLQAQLAAARHHIDALQEQTRVLLAHVRSLQTLTQTILRSRASRVLRALGRWKFVDQAFVDLPAGEASSRRETRS